MKRLFAQIAALLLVLVPLAQLPLYAQFAQRGGIAGTVFDQTGALVPGVEITIVEVAEKQTRTSKADSAGHYEFNNLAAGQYQVTAVLESFQAEQSGVLTVNLGTVARFDFKLRPGSATESVNVTDETNGLETDNATLNTNVTSRQFEELPLNGRNFTAIAALVPGVSTYPQSNINPGGTYAAGATFAFGGTQYTTGGSFEGSRDNGVYINGVNINDNYESNISYAPSAEAVGTGTIQVADFSAAVGHDISALSIQTKGGSSKFHGEAYDFLENNALNATNPYANAYALITTLAPAVKPTVKRNQFGGNFGGPVWIPKLLPQLRDKLFFFANYEKLIEHDGNQLVGASVPSAAERTGDFSELLGTNASPVQLYNPFFTTYDPATGESVRPLIPGNRLDLAKRPDGSPLLDPGAAAIQNALWPLPNVPGVPSNEINYTAFQSQGVSNYHLDTRFDARFGSRDSIFVTYSKQAGTTTITGGVPPSNLHNFPLQDDSYIVTTNYARVFTPHLTNEFVFGVSHGSLLSLTSGQAGYLNSSSNPLNQVFTNTGTGFTHGILAVYAGNYAAAGTGEVFEAGNQAYQFSDNVDLTAGRHTVTAGFNYFRKSELDWDVQRSVTFGGFTNSGALTGYTGGDAQADLELGLPSNLYVRYAINGGGPTAPDHNIIFPYWGMYVNDKFRISPKLTISAGLRYELNIPDFTKDPHSAPCCAIYSPTTDGGVLKYPGIAAGLPQHYLSTSKLDFAPRVSVAYSVTPQIVVRAGYGIFYDAGSTQISTNLLNAIYGSAAAVNYSVNTTTLGTPVDTPVLNFGSIFPAPQTTNLGSFPVSTGAGQGYSGDGQLSTVIYSDQRSTVLPYYQRMLLDVQQQIRGHDIFTISYAGVQGRKGTNETNLNLPQYRTGWINGGGSGDPTFNVARPNNVGRFGDIFVIRGNLNSFYNALIVQYRHDFAQGIQLTSSYTWGKTISDYPFSNNVVGGASIGGGGTGLQYANLKSRGESTQSHRHRFVTSGIWSPVYGRKWPEFAKVPFTGWRLTGIVTLESGDALTVSAGGTGNVCDVNDPLTSTHCYNNTAAGAYTGSSPRDDAGLAQLNTSGNPNIGHGSKSFTHQFDTSRFFVPNEDVRGNSGFGTVIGPGQERVDLSIAKTFEVYERLHLEFRGDTFNAFNHSQWNGVNTTYPSGNPQFPFGQVNSAGDARIGQVAAKLVF